MRLPAVIGINPADRKGEERARSLDGCQDQLLAPMQEGKALGPACGHIGERQGEQVTALSVFATVGYQVRFQKAGTGLIPRLERTNRDLLL
jgi:hypothetical protein